MHTTAVVRVGGLEFCVNVLKPACLSNIHRIKQAWLLSYSKGTVTTKHTVNTCKCHFIYLNKKVETDIYIEDIYRGYRYFSVKLCLYVYFMDCYLS